MNLENTRLPLLLRAYILFVAAAGYFWTMAPSISLWDSAEFSAAISELGIPHPPGTPFYMLLGKFWDICLSPVSEPAYRHNLLSVAGALLCLWLLFELSLIFSRKFFNGNWAVYTVALSGPMLLTFSKTFWFNAVETEVYSLSMAIMLLEAWLVFSIPGSPTESKRKKVLLFVFLSILGIGIHMYSMLLFVPLYIISGQFLGKLSFGKTGKSFMLRNAPFWAVGVCCSLVIVNTGWFLVSLIAMSILLGLYWLWKKENELKFSLLTFLLAGIAYSHQLYLPIRSNLNPYLNENSPKTWEGFLETVERKQYGSENMLSRMFHRRAAWSSQFTNGSRIGFLNYQLSQYWVPPSGDSIWRQFHGIATGLIFGFTLLGIWEMRKKNRPWAIYLLCIYAVSSIGLVLYMNFSDGSKINHIHKKIWENKARMVYEKLKTEDPELPAFPDPNTLARMNLLLERFPDDRSKWLSGKEGKMYMEYIQLQNLAVRQGLEFPRIPDAEPMEVRERDYFFSPAFIWFSLMVSMALVFFLKWLVQKIQLYFPAISQRKTALRYMVLTVSGLLWVPGFTSYFHSHNRQGDYVAKDFALNTLTSCPPGAVLYTNGDNDTFPLWYLQSALGVRKDVTVVNFSLSNLEWYIRQLAEGPKPLSFPNVLKDNTFPRPAWVKFQRPQVFSALGDSSIKIIMGKESPYQLLDVQSLALMDIALHNYPQRPVCFNIMTPAENLLCLNRFFEERGLINCLSSKPEFILERLDSLLFKAYSFQFSPKYAFFRDHYQLIWPYKSLVEQGYEAHLKLKEAYLSEGKINQAVKEEKWLKKYSEFSEKWNLGANLTQSP